MRATFGDLKENAISVLSAVLSATSDNFLQKKLQEIERMKALDPHTVALDFLPGGQIFTRDTLALTQGLHVAPHQSILALPLSAAATEAAIDSLEKAARLSAVHLQRLEQRLDQSSPTSVRNTNDVMNSGDWYDVMQVCLNGHEITACAGSEPKTRQNFCDNCGEKTIASCQSCGNTIRGHRHIAGERIPPTHEVPVPKYCINCGAAYPWQQAAIDNLKDVFKEAELSPHDIAVIEAALPDVLRDTPRTESSSLKVKRILGKLGKPFYDISIKVITDIATETAKKTLGLGP